MSDTWLATYLLLWAIVAVQGIFLMGALRQLGIIHLRLGSDPGVLITPEGLPRGALAPDFEAPITPTGEMVRRTDFLGRRVMVVFLSPTCMSCKQLIPHLNAIHEERRDEVATLVVCHGAEGSCAEFVRRFGVRPRVVADLQNVIATSFGVSATPFAYLLDESGHVLIRGVANDWTHLERLLEEEGTFQSRPWPSPPSQTETAAAQASPVSREDDRELVEAPQ